MERGNAGPLEATRGALGVERIAVAGVCIGNHRDPDHIDDRGETLGNFVR
jgi:hypothetical protein